MSNKGLSAQAMATIGHDFGTPASFKLVTCTGAETKSVFANVPFRIRILRAWGVMKAAGTAGDTVKIQKVFNGTTSVITEVSDISLLTDKELFDFETYDDASWSVPRGAALQVVTAGGPTTSHVDVFVLFAAEEA